MKYIKQTPTGHYNPTYRTEEITRDEAISLVGLPALTELINNNTAKETCVNIVQEVSPNLYVGVQW